MTDTVNAAVTDAELEALEELEDLLGAGDDEQATSAESDEVIADDDLADLAAALEETAPVAAPAPEKPKKTARKKGTPKKAEEAAAEAPAEGEPAPESASEPEGETGAAPPAKTPRLTFASTSAALFHKIGDSELALVMDDAERPQVEIRAEIAGIVDGSAKKVQEKALNLIACAVRGGTLSVYTKIALANLFEAGKITSADLAQAYRDNPDPSYSDGTARAQSGQMMKLLPALKIAARAGSTLVVNEDSVLALSLREMVGA